MNSGTGQVNTIIISNGSFGAIGPNSRVNITYNTPIGGHRYYSSSSIQRSDRVTGREQPLEEIPYEVERRIVEMLDAISSHDFRELAGYCNMTQIQVSNLAQNGRTRELLRILCEKRRNVGFLVDQLRKMERFDVIEVIGVRASEYSIQEQGSTEKQGVEEQRCSMSSCNSPVEIDSENGTSKETPPPTQETENGQVTSPADETKIPVECESTMNEEIVDSSVIKTQPSRYMTQESDVMVSKHHLQETGDSRDAKEEKAISNVEPAQFPAKERAGWNGNCCSYPGKAVNCSSEQKKKSLDSNTSEGTKSMDSTRANATYLMRYDSDEEDTIIARKLNISDSDAENDPGVS